MSSALWPWWFRSSWIIYCNKPLCYWWCLEWQCLKRSYWFLFKWQLLLPFIMSVVQILKCTYNVFRGHLLRISYYSSFKAQLTTSVTEPYRMWKWLPWKFYQDVLSLSCFSIVWTSPHLFVYRNKYPNDLRAMLCISKPGLTWYNFQLAMVVT